jgi:predicted DNA-binding protein (MmcQ/YjbR family)
MPAAVCNRRATPERRKSGATRRARAPWAVCLRCSLLTGRCGHPRRSRLAIHPKALSRGVAEYFNRLLMDLAQFREYCLSKSCATEGMAFGPDVLVFKVRGKMFALAVLDEMPTTVNLKCDPDLALELRDRYDEVTPGYHMNKKHWNTVRIEGGIPDPELRKMIDHSYDPVAKGLPKPKAKIAARSRRNSTAARHVRRLGNCRPSQ